MYIPNYIPEPDAIPRNVTKEKYPLRLVFIRQVMVRFMATVAGIAVLATFGGPIEPEKVLNVLLIFFGLLVVSSVIRTVLRFNPKEASVAEVVPFLLCLGYALVFSMAKQFGLPVWSALIGLGCFFAYSSLCGRDFSFVGGFVLSLIASSVFIATIMVVQKSSPGVSSQALGWNAAVLLYVVYDLAALMSRRQVHERWAAVADLYRDPLNFVGYMIRVIKHWRRHRIYQDFTPEIPFKELGSK